MENNGNGKACLFRITGEDRHALEAVLFKRYPHREWGTFFYFGYRTTSWGIHVTFVNAIEPRPNDLKRASGIVEFDAGYILRAQFALEKTDLGIGVAHSHPFGCNTGRSCLDDDMDRYFAAEFSHYGRGRPYVSLRIARGRNGEIVFSGECWLSGGRIPITQMLTVGHSLRRETAELSADVSCDNSSAEQTARVAALLGQDKLDRLKRSSVAIVGCSGTGSPAAHVLARAGIGAFTLVDPEVFEPSNHERFHASRSSDLKTSEPKVNLVRRMITAINPFARITTIEGDILDEAVLNEVLRCDIVLGCTDTHSSRAALSDYATHYLLPCIDSAVLMRANDGKLTEQVGELARYTAQEACAWCLGRIDQKVVWYEVMSDTERAARKRAAKEAIERGVDGEQYWGGEPPKELTIGYMTTVVGSMQAGYALGWLAGAAEMPHQRFQFDLGMPLLGAVAVDKQRRSECSCARTKGWSDQAQADRSVTPAFERQREVPNPHVGTRRRC